MSWFELVASVCSVYMNPALPDIIESKSNDFKIDKHLVLSIIHTESRCKHDAVGSVGELGLMQISPRWHTERMVKLNSTNLLDPAQNINVGLDLLSELNVNSNMLGALMIYNGGYVESTQSKSYAKSVVEKFEVYKAMTSYTGRK